MNLPEFLGSDFFLAFLHSSKRNFPEFSGISLERAFAIPKSLFSEEDEVDMLGSGELCIIFSHRAFPGMLQVIISNGMVPRFGIHWTKPCSDHKVHLHKKGRAVDRPPMPLSETSDNLEKDPERVSHSLVARGGQRSPQQSDNEKCQKKSSQPN